MSGVVTNTKPTGWDSIIGSPTAFLFAVIQFDTSSISIPYPDHAPPLPHPIMQHPQRNGGRNLEAIGMGVGVVMVLGFLMLQQQVGSSMISPGKREGLLARMSQQQHAHGIAATAGAAEVDMRLSHLEEVTSKLRSSSKISSLTAEVGHLQQENSALQREFHTLVDEMEHLKTLMRQHHELKDDIDKTTDKTKAHHDSSSDDSASSDSTDTSNTEDHNKEDSSAEASEASSDEVDIHLLPDERRATGLNAALQNIDCPVPTPMLQMEIPLEHLPRKKRTTVAQKYDRRAGNCNKHGLWSSVSREDHFKIMSKIGDLIRVKQGDLLFDWGCGCGHKLHWFAQKYNTSGLGVCISPFSFSI